PGQQGRVAGPPPPPPPPAVAAASAASSTLLHGPHLHAHDPAALDAQRGRIGVRLRGDDLHVPEPRAPHRLQVLALLERARAAAGPRPAATPHRGPRPAPAPPHR